MDNMKYFKNVNSLAELKTQYKALAMKHHPDCGGTTEAMQEVNNEFDMLFVVYKNINFANSTEPNSQTASESSETAYKFKREFYTSNGWQGSRYDHNLNTKDIAKLVKTFCKTVYPTCKFSITSDYHSINIYLMEANFEVFANESDKYTRYDDGTKLTANMQLNQFSILENKKLTERAKTMFYNIHEYLKSYNYDNSDAMTDYFDTNFYEHLEIGKWDRPFKVVEKMERLAGKTEKSEVD